MLQTIDIPETIDMQISLRTMELIDLSQNGGITPCTVLSEQFQRRFDLDSGDPNVFVQNIVSLRKHKPAYRAELNAALHALGIPSEDVATAELRHTSRQLIHSSDRIDIDRGRNLAQYETRGFKIIAEKYDTVTSMKRSIAERKKLSAGASI